MKIIDKTKELIAEHIITSLFVILSLLFGSLWLAFRSLFYEYILPAIAKETLAELLAGTIALLLMVLAYTFYLKKELGSKMIPRFGIYWFKKNLIPHCPACEKPLSNYRLHWVKQTRILAFYCVHCKDYISLVDDNGKHIDLKDAKKILENKP